VIREHHASALPDSIDARQLRSSHSGKARIFLDLMARAAIKMEP